MADTLDLDFPQVAQREPLIVHCEKCSHEWAIGFIPIPLDVLAKLGKSSCPSCKSTKVLFGLKPKPSGEGDYAGWLSNGDTGISSETIWTVMTGRRMGKPHWYADTPSDPSDFGRCYRLLKVMPSWRARLPEVSARYHKWKPLVEAWDELTALYEEELPTGTCRKLYDRMHQLVDRT